MSFFQVDNIGDIQGTNAALDDTILVRNAGELYRRVAPLSALPNSLKINGFYYTKVKDSYALFKGATDTDPAISDLVPYVAANSKSKILHGDGEWRNPLGVKDGYGIVSGVSTGTRLKKDSNTLAWQHVTTCGPIKLVIERSGADHLRILYAVQKDTTVDLKGDHLAGYLDTFLLCYSGADSDTGATPTLTYMSGDSTSTFNDGKFYLISGTACYNKDLSAATSYAYGNNTGAFNIGREPSYGLPYFEMSMWLEGTSVPTFFWNAKIGFAGVDTYKVFWTTNTKIS